MSIDKGIFRSAITDGSGKTVDVGYLSLYWLMVLDAFLSVAALLTGWVQQYHFACPEVQAVLTQPLPLGAVPIPICHAHTYPFTDVGLMLTAIWGTFSTALSALGLFRRGDQTPKQPS